MKTKLELSDIEAAIAAEKYTVLDDGRTTVAQLTLKNGFTVTGVSACVDKSNFDAATGQAVARGNAMSKIWELEGYLLKQRLWDASQAGKAPDRKPVEARWDRNPMNYEMRFWVKWSDGSTELLRREDAVELRKSWPWLFAGADMSGY